MFYLHGQKHNSAMRDWSLIFSCYSVGSSHLGILSGSSIMHNTLESGVYPSTDLKIRIQGMLLIPEEVGV